MIVVGCFIEYGGKFVLLRRHAHKPEGGTLGLPGGKVEKDETDQQAVLREIKEETGYIAHENELEKLGEYDFESTTGQFYKYITFRIRLKSPHEIKLEEKAHSEFMWTTPQECFARNDLIKDLDNLLMLVGYIK